MSLHPDFKDKLKQLGKAVTELISVTQNTSADDSKVSRLFEGVDNAFRDLALLMSPKGRTHQGFSEFFSTVGQAVMEAQKNLDSASIDYLDHPTRSADDLLKKLRPDLNDDENEEARGEALRALKAGLLRAPRSFFRIPKVSAEMKFSLEKVSSTSVGLVFYSEKNEAREQHQQTLSFDIVAVPPPADYVMPRPAAEEGLEAARLAPVRTLVSGSSAVPTPDDAAKRTRNEISFALPLMLDDGARARALSTLTKGHPGRSAKTDPLRRDSARKARDRVLVFGGEEQGPRFFVLAGRRPASLLLWKLDPATSGVRLSYRMPATSAAREALAPLHELFADLCDAQERHLGSRA